MSTIAPAHHAASDRIMGRARQLYFELLQSRMPEWRFGAMVPAEIQDSCTYRALVIALLEEKTL